MKNVNKLNKKEETGTLAKPEGCKPKSEGANAKLGSYAAHSARQVSKQQVQGSEAMPGPSTSKAASLTNRWNPGLRQHYIPAQKNGRVHLK